MNLLKKYYNPSLLWATLTSLSVPFYIFLGTDIYGDVIFYYPKLFEQALEGKVSGVTVEGAYPYGVILPIMLAGFIGSLFGDYLSGWVLVVVLLNFITIYVVGRKYSLQSKHFFIIFLANMLMSSVSSYRLDIVAVFLTVIAVAVFDKHKQLAYFLLVFGVFVKIWPIAVIVAIWLLSNEKIKDIIKVATYATVFLLPPLLLGGVNVAFSFLSFQSSRGIQIESLYAIPLFLQGNKVYYSAEEVTYRIDGFGAEVMSNVSNIIIFAILAAAALLGFTKYWRTPATVKEAFLIANIIIVSFIVFNKVGSAQFVIWLLLALLLTFAYVKPSKIRVYVGSVLASIFASGQIYPYFFEALLDGGYDAILLLIVKNFMMLVFLIMLIMEYVYNVKTNGIEPNT